MKEAKEKKIEEKPIVVKKQEEKKRITKYVDVDIEREKMIARKNAINNATKNVKVFFKFMSYIIIALIVLFLGKMLYKLFLFLGQIHHASYVSFGILVLKVIGVIIGFIVLFFIFKFIFSFLVNISFPKIRFKIPKWFKTFIKAICYPFIKIYYFFAFVIGSIGKIISFLIQMVKSNCPATKWQD